MASTAVWASVELFLSTPSVRRATGFACRGKYRGVISIHALREEGDLNTEQYLHKSFISIHALREEGDALVFAPAGAGRHFYPRPP